MDGFDDKPCEPHWLFHAAGLLGQFAQGGAVPLGRAGSEGERFLSPGIIGSKEDPPLGFGSQEAIAGFHVEPIYHVLRQRGTDGAPNALVGLPIKPHAAASAARL